jgi:hypothetical protein
MDDRSSVLTIMVALGLVGVAIVVYQHMAATDKLLAAIASNTAAGASQSAANASQTISLGTPASPAGTPTLGQSGSSQAPVVVPLQINPGWLFQ